MNAVAKSPFADTLKLARAASKAMLAFGDAVTGR